MIDARDDQGDPYFLQVLEIALTVKPELVFEHIDAFKDWKDNNGKPILKQLLEFAIAQKPQLAYDYLSLSCFVIKPRYFQKYIIIL